jgi:predicted nucleotidyltransferase
MRFEPNANPGLFTMTKIETKLPPFLGGREVDLRAAANLGRYFRDEAVKTAEVQYGVR